MPNQGQDYEEHYKAKTQRMLKLLNKLEDLTEDVARETGPMNPLLSQLQEAHETLSSTIGARLLTFERRSSTAAEHRIET